MWAILPISSISATFALGLPISSVKNSLELLQIVANVGDVRSQVIHPASTTHSQLSPEQLVAAGISEGTVRLTIGIEDINDIIADISQALDKATK